MSHWEEAVALHSKPSYIRAYTTMCVYKTSRPALGPTQFPTHCVPGSFAGGKLAGARS